MHTFVCILRRRHLDTSNVYQHMHLLHGTITFRFTDEGTLPSTCLWMATRAFSASTSASWLSFQHSSVLLNLMSCPRVVSNVRHANDFVFSIIWIVSSIMLFAEQKPVIITFFRWSWQHSERHCGREESAPGSSTIESGLKVGIWICTEIYECTIHNKTKNVFN